MDAQRFDAITKAWGRMPRRQVLQGGLVAALGGLLAVGSPNGAAAACLQDGARCGGEREPCCSGFCQRKRGSRKKVCRRGPDQGTCESGSDSCASASVRCNGNPSCFCFQTVHETTRCATSTFTACGSCLTDSDCKGQHGDTAFCVRGGPSCTGCTTRFQGLCALPCPS